MTPGAVLTTAGITLPLLMGGVYWLLRSFITNRLTAVIEAEKAGFARELETHRSALASELENKKAALQAELAREKAGVEGEVRRAVELELGQQAAERQYALEARRRLYLAIGPLRFQLLLACRDYASRISAHGRGQRYRLNMASYYGQSTLYRLLRPLALGELIERQIAYSDFSVDDGAIDCLRFKKTLVRLLSGPEVVCGHPKADWSQQSEHVYADAVVVGASGLICRDGETWRVMRFEEFRVELAKHVERFEPFHGLLRDLDLTRKPIFWLRLVACANACSGFVNHAGDKLGFDPVQLPLPELIAAPGDAYIDQNRDAFLQAIENVSLVRL